MVDKTRIIRNLSRVLLCTMLALLVLCSLVLFAACDDSNNNNNCIGFGNTCNQNQNVPATPPPAATPGSF